MKNIIISIISIIGFIFCDKKNDIDIWYRAVPNPSTQETIILELDMSQGFMIADQDIIYIIVKERITDQLIRMAFSNGEHFMTDGSYWDPVDNKFHSDDIHDYLINGDEIKKDEKKR